jgi:LmbE family N-acetylglucosaminyl deacetylase
MLELRMKPRTNSFRKFVSEYARLFQSAKKLPLGCPKKYPRHPQVPDNAPKALIFSPHPDDECIVGGLALRLLREAKWNVINVAVTLGGNPARRQERFGELLDACCCLLDFDLILAGLENINPAGRKKRRAGWNAAVKTMAKFLLCHRPRVIFLPHENDGHPTHIGTHFLVVDALKTLPAGFKCHVVETEFWGQMTNPNLLVESGIKDVGDLVAALACHVGEVRRNAYHARLPAWMMDNVRRGAELVGGPSPRRSGFVHAGGLGGAAPDFTFATLYRHRQWSRGRLTDVLKGRKFLSCSENAAKLFG